MTIRDPRPDGFVEDWGNREVRAVSKSDSIPTKRLGGDPTTVTDWRAEARRWKTTTLLREAANDPRPTIHVVPTVGPNPSALTKETTEPTMTGALDIEAKVDDHDLDHTTLQVHGYAKCPSMADIEEGSDDPTGKELAIRHEQECHGLDNLDEDELNRWLDNGIRLDDYNTIHDEHEICPVLLAERCLEELDSEHLVVMTRPKLGVLLRGQPGEEQRAWFDNLVAKKEETDLDGAKLRVHFDEYHALFDYLIADKMEIQGSKAAFLHPDQAPWTQDPAPDDWSHRLKAIVDRALRRGRIAADYHAHFLQARKVLYAIKRLKKAVQDGKPPDELKRRWNHDLDGINVDEVIHPHLPNFIDRLLAKDRSPAPPEAVPADINDPASCDYAEHFLTAAANAWKHLTDLPDAYHYWGALANATPLIRNEHEYKALQGLNDWLAKRAAKRVNGYDVPDCGEWERAARFVLRAHKEDAAIVPLPTTDRNSDELTGVIYHAVRGRFELQPSRDQARAELINEFTAIHECAEAGCEVHTASATPLRPAFMETCGIETTPADTSDLAPPPDMTFICQLVSRGQKAWTHPGSTRSRFKKDVQQVDQMAPTGVEWFVRGSNEEELVGKHTDLDDPYVARSHESKAVQLDTDNMVAFTGPPIMPIDLDVNLLFNPELTAPASHELHEAYLGAEEVRLWDAVVQIVQTGYRTAQAGETSHAVVLSCRKEFVDRLRQYLVEKGYEDHADVVTVQPKQKEHRRTRNLLEAGGLEPEPPDRIQKLIGTIIDRIEASDDDVYEKHVVKRWDIEVVYDQTAWPTQPQDRKDALDRAEDLGLLSREPWKPIELLT